MEENQIKVETSEPIEKILSTKTILELEGVEVFVDYFWDSHGKLIPWSTGKEFPKYRKTADVRIDEMESVIGKANFTSWELYINGKKINCELYKYAVYNNNTRIKLKAAVGWG